MHLLILSIAILGSDKSKEVHVYSCVYSKKSCRSVDFAGKS